jgi:hypothetical protein
MKNMVKLRDVVTGRLYAFLTLDQANNFVDGFDRPFDLVGVDVK